MTEPVGQRRPEQSAASPAAQTPRGRGGRLAVIDGLRLVAALAVALFHYAGASKVGERAWEATTSAIFPKIFPVASYGFLGVELFFLISGFVICMSSWGRTLGQFFRSRVIRLYPAYWAAIVITTVVVFFWPVALEHLKPNEILVNLTMFNAPLGIPYVDNSYWTLWAEMRFYLIFAVALVWPGLTLRRTVIFCYAWLIGGVLSIDSDMRLLKVLLQADFGPYFAAGVGFYLIHRFGGDIKLWGIVVFSWVLCMHNVVRRVFVNGRSSHIELSPTVGMLIVTAFFLIMAVIALGWTARIQWRWLTTAGLLTYPFYLLHQSLGWAIIHGMRDVRPRKLTLVAVLVIMLLIAWLLHKLVEKPLARWLKVKLEAASTAAREQRLKREPDDTPPPAAPAQHREPASAAG